MIWAYFIDTTPLNDDSLYQAIYENTSVARREKADKLRLRNDRNLCLGAGFLLDCGLHEHGLREAEQEYGTLGNGKPVFLDLPDLRFSLSHSGTIAMAALSACGIGCDIEKVREFDMAVAKRFFAPGEYKTLLKQPTEEARQDMFFRFWTLKESFLKATGQGLALPMHDFEISIEDDSISIIQMTDNREFFFRELNAYAGYKCSVCSEEEKPELQICYPEFRI